MSFTRALPFRSASNALVAKLVSVPAMLHARVDGSWDAFSEGPDRFSLDVDVDIDLERLGSCLPEGYSPEEEFELVAISKSVSSRQRTRLDHYEPSNQELSFDFDPADHVGKVELQLAAILKRDLPVVAGYAHLRSTAVAVADVATLWFDEPPISAGNNLDIQWVDFGKDPDLPDENLFAIRLEDRPMILLNSGITYAYQILNSKGHHGVMARIRDAVFMTIVHQAWSSILSQAFVEVVRLDEEDPSSVLEELGTWQEQVLTAWARDFVPGEADQRAATERLIETIQESGPELVLTHLADAIQSRYSTVNGFNGLVKESDKFSQGGSS